jgi:hypothetical protein
MMMMIMVRAGWFTSVCVQADGSRFHFDYSGVAIRFDFIFVCIYKAIAQQKELMIMMSLLYERRSWNADDISDLYKYSFLATMSACPFFFAPTTVDSNSVCSTITRNQTACS